MPANQRRGVRSGLAVLTFGGALLLACSGELRQSERWAIDESEMELFEILTTFQPLAEACRELEVTCQEQGKGCKAYDLFCNPSTQQEWICLRLFYACQDGGNAKACGIYQSKCASSPGGPSSDAGAGVDAAPPATDQGTPPPPPPTNGKPAITKLKVASPSVKVYEKFEVTFDVATLAPSPFFEYTAAPPPGVPAGTGITVQGVITTPSGSTVTHPAFFTAVTEVVNPGSASMYFKETAASTWVLRYSPQEPGVHQVSLSAQDASGTNVVAVGSFTATPPSRPGFIRVSPGDSRYFAHSDGSIYWPIGPAWLEGSASYTSYLGTGQNFERVWMAGRGAYATNWARWKSSAELHGNEGIMTRLSWREHLPGHELSYELFYPEGYRLWVSSWMDDLFAGRIEAGKTYRVKLTYKTANLAGPSSRCASCPYGLVIKVSDASAAIWGDPSLAQVENALRIAPQLVGHIQTSDDWKTITTTFTAPANATNIHVFLDNVSAGQAYVDELSLKEVNSQGVIVGGEVIRNPRADQHTYVEARAAAFFDWQLEQAAASGVAIKYVVHDKNDWIQNHLSSAGQFVDPAQAGGYYQAENTKARWLLRQWYRYLAARYGHSTAVHSFELNNEGPPNEEGGGTAAHWATAQAFAQYLHGVDAHHHLANTSFWCCWRPAFWGNDALFPDVDHGDIHDYTSNSSLTEYTGQPVSSTDVAGWISGLGMMVLQSQVGKPVIIAESGIVEAGGWEPLAALKQSNPGIWYHDLLWSQLNAGAVFSPNYWFSEHLQVIDRTKISEPFARFVAALDVHQGGYTDLGPHATVSNPGLRLLGQINPVKGRAYLWVQNKKHSWATPSPTGQSGTLTITGFKASQALTLKRWDTTSGVISTSTVTASGSGAVSLAVSNLVSDVAYTIGL